jgi:D-glycero-D-manno-heptose 1,7-bisphosphate phosphatase
MKPVVFIERDGVLNKTKVVNGHAVCPLELSSFEINEEAIIPLRQLKQAGFLLIATTNQPGLSNGSLNRREMDLMHHALMRSLPLDDILVCPHSPNESCPCRKPKPGLMLEAAFKWHIDLERSFVISDKWQDAQAAHLAGCTSILLRGPLNGQTRHDYVMDTLPEIAKKILRLYQDNSLVIH